MVCGKKNGGVGHRCAARQCVRVCVGRCRQVGQAHKMVKVCTKRELEGGRGMQPQQKQKAEAVCHAVGRWQAKVQCVCV